MHHQHKGHGAEQCGAVKIFEQIDRRLFVHALIHRQRGGDGKQGMRIGRRARHQFSSDIAGGPWAVIDDEGLPQTFGKARRDQPRHNVGARTRRKADENAHGFTGVRLRLHQTANKRRTKTDSQSGAASSANKRVHGWTHEKSESVS